MTVLDHLRSRLGDRYVIERELGRGGMGAVYLARDIRLDRPVALKVMPSEYAELPALRERFLRETRLAASFSHPNIVPVYAVEEASDLLAYAMGFIEGESLAERVKRAGPLGARDTVRLLQDVGYALAYAHGRGVVHRDIKPDNIMIERATGRALVMDFGIARMIAAPVANDADGLTRVGEVVGTPEYMSPEQATGDRVDGRSDLYSLGLTAYFALVGRTAVAGDTTGKVLAKQITEQLPPMSTVRADLPPALTGAIDKCVAKDPDARFVNAESLIEELDAAQLTAPPIPVSIRVLVGELGALSLLLIAGAGVLFYLGDLLLENIRLQGSLDAMLPMVAVLSVLAVRTLQMRADAQRLAADGFTAEDVHRGMQAIMAERDGRREELRQNPRVRAARRRTVQTGVGQLVGAVVSVIIALHFRQQTAPHRYRIGWDGTAFTILSMILLGAGLSRLARTPLRMPAGERLFRLVWLGPIGRAFVRAPRSAQIVQSPTGPSHAVITRAPERAMPTSAPRAPAQDGAASRAAADAGVSVPADAAADRVARLESRVAELERWRSTAK